MSAAASTTVDGLDVSLFVNTAGSSQIQPEPGQSRFCAPRRTAGGPARTTVQRLRGTDVRDTSVIRPFMLEGADRPVAHDGNGAPNAIPNLLQALVSCLAVGVAYNAAARGITLRLLDEMSLARAANAPAQAAVPGGIVGRLTPREREVALLIARGHTNREIAAALVITEPTAERHVANIFNKLGVRSRSLVAVWAAQHLARGTPG